MNTRKRQRIIWPEGIVAVMLAAIILMANYSFGQTFSFAVLSDPHDGADEWKNALREIRDKNIKSIPPISPAEFILVSGDMNPVVPRHKDYQSVFVGKDPRPVLLPVVGNHEYDSGGESFRYMRDVLIPSVSNAVRRHATACDYYFDHKNVRVIVVDGFTDLGKKGVLNKEGRQWVDQVIRKTPSAIDHIFISFHVPAFPRFRHVGESFDKDPEARNALWRMLLGHKDRVRAVFVGHTHFYCRMKVNDPEGAAANNSKSFPDDEGGLYQITSGNCRGMKDTTLVQVQIEGKKVFFRILQAKKGASEPFAEIDKWSIVNNR